MSLAFELQRLEAKRQYTPLFPGRRLRSKGWEVVDDRGGHAKSRCRLCGAFGPCRMSACSSETVMVISSGKQKTRYARFNGGFVSSIQAWKK